MTTSDEVEEKIECDGYVKLYLYDPYGDEAIYKCFDFNEIRYISVEDWGMRVVMAELSNGQERVYAWPWDSILHFEHMSNSDEVSQKLQKRAEEKSLEKYANGSMDIIEKIANGFVQAADTFGSPHVHAEENGPKVSHGFETPCGHGAAVQATNSEVWTCLECASQWHQTQWSVDG